MTLLEKALQVPNRKKEGSVPGAARIERAELALAYFAGKISTKQAAVALGSGNNNVTNTLNGILAYSIRNGIILASIKAE